MPDSPFDVLRARGLLVQCGIALVAAAGSYLLIASAPGGGSRPDARVLGIITMLAMTLVVLVRARRAGLDWGRLFGPAPRRGSLPLLAVVVPVDVLTYGAVPLVFIPLSYVAPDFVRNNLLTISPLFRVTTLAQWSTLMFVAAVLAPLFEETLFRGILLHRWARRWGTRTGVIASSALFAIGHAEILGHFLFGVAMCALYLRTRQLWLPILAHGVSNFALMFPTLATVLSRRPEQPETLAEFRSEWWIGALALAAGVVLMSLYLRRYWPAGLLRTVLTGPVPYERVPAARSAVGDAPAAFGSAESS